MDSLLPRQFGSRADSGAHRSPRARHANRSAPRVWMAASPPKISSFCIRATPSQQRPHGWPHYARPTIMACGSTPSPITTRSHASSPAGPWGSRWAEARSAASLTSASSELCAKPPSRSISSAAPARARSWPAKSSSAGPWKRCWSERGFRVNPFKGDYTLPTVGVTTAAR